jgi:hypothetical protein
MLDVLRHGESPYCLTGARLYGREITKHGDPAEYHLSKVCVLSCSYGTGWEKFFDQCRGKGLEITETEARRAIDAFRETHPEIVKLWARLNGVLVTLANGKMDQLGPLKIEGGAIVLPNNLRMVYQLRWDSSEQSWRRMGRGYEERIWGGVLCENACSSLARVILSDVMLRAKRELGIRPVFCVHDSLVYVVPEDRAEETMAKVLDMMSTTPAWWRNGPPLAAEGTISTRYGGDI